MTITWYGHSCFRLESKDVSLLIDPFSAETGLRPPKIKDNIVLVSHQHYDHNNIEGLPEDAFLAEGPGEYEVKGVFVKGIQSFHDKSQGRERGLNTVYVLKMEDMTLVHMGDFGQEGLTEEQVEKIGDVDVLMIPVGGNYTINYKEAVGVIREIEPKIVIPMHYKIQGLNVDIDGPEKFLKEVGLTPEKAEKSYKIQKKNLPSEEMKLVVFNI
ncbi:MAG: MBL fold metallo-hydrolase [Parcubacteria group bacterium]|nr:MBL fold metallo-hydrolase [Parcubacteria group bacterium]